MARTHITWSVEKTVGRCPTCDNPTMLITPCVSWNVDQDEDVPRDLPDEVEVYDEVSAHYCERCDRITSLSLNTFSEE